MKVSPGKYLSRADLDVARRRLARGSSIDPADLARALDEVEWLWEENDVLRAQNAIWWDRMDPTQR